MKYDYSIPEVGAGSPASPAAPCYLDEQTDENFVAPTPFLPFPIPPSRLQKGTWFDEAVDFRNPEGDTFTTAVLTLIASVEDRKRKRRPDDQINHQKCVRKVLANAFRCFWYRELPLVSFLRKADGYPDKPTWLSGKAMARTTDLMASAGLLNVTLGEPATSSTYDATKLLCAIAEDCGVGAESITLRRPIERLVRLRTGPPERTDLRFEETSQTSLWAILLASYNDCIAAQDITLDLSDEERIGCVAHWNSKRPGGIPIRRPELFQTDLYRQFNNGSFNEGGRLYGGWWQNTPGHLRKRILINGQPTVERDYSGCAIGMLYHQRGIPCPTDPYRLEEIVAFELEAGLEDGHYRPTIKRLLNSMVNARENGRPANVLRKYGYPYPDIFTPSELVKMLEKKHEPIADAFRSGAGLYLQRADSDLALEIITKLKNKGIVALPIHDSFIVQEYNFKELNQHMIDSYKTMFKYDPTIK